MVDNIITASFYLENPDKCDNSQKQELANFIKYYLLNKYEEHKKWNLITAMKLAQKYIFTLDKLKKEGIKPGRFSGCQMNK